MFVWLFHRVSGLALLLLMTLKIVTGLATAGRMGPHIQNTVGLWHQARVIDLPLLFFFLYHGLYGLRTMWLDLGWGREKAVFWSATVAAGVLFLCVGFFFYF
jgi:succinate dehydrogenase hydrophobic anchor subunit